MEDWGEEIFPEGVGVKRKMGKGGGEEKMRLSAGFVRLRNPTIWTGTLIGRLQVNWACHLPAWRGEGSRRNL